MQKRANARTLREFALRIAARNPLALRYFRKAARWRSRRVAGWRCGELNPCGRQGVNTQSDSVAGSVARLASPAVEMANLQRLVDAMALANASPAGVQRMTVAARDLRSGDVVLAAVGLVVRSVDCFGAVCIVDFEDGTATAPVPAGGLVAIERETGGAS